MQPVSWQLIAIWIPYQLGLDWLIFLLEFSANFSNERKFATFTRCCATALHAGNLRSAALGSRVLAYYYAAKIVALQYAIGIKTLV